MAKASAMIALPVEPGKVWQLIGGFDALPDWLPYIPKSELSEGGRVRHLANPDGDAIVERLEAFDNGARSYTYSILEAPFPVTGYRSTLRVVGTDGDRASRVEWSGEFTPVGVSDDAASELFEGIYRDGLKALEATLAAAQP
ncbi:MAG: SRPBCC family protein [Achromobacter sp.]|uniref:SRPBCC family protein n=1 Tax=Achromobacter sp. TaxID=134375 RepID=UPI003CFD3593